MPRTLPRLYLVFQDVMNTIEMTVCAFKTEDEVEDKLVNEVDLGEAIHEEKLQRGEVVFYRAIIEQCLRKISNFSKLVAVSRIIIRLLNTETKLSLQLLMPTVMPRITCSTICWTGPS